MTVSVNPCRCLAGQQQRPARRRWLGRVGLAALSVTTAVAGAAHAAEWNAGAWQEESTLEFRTTEAGNEKWSTVWFVVIDGDVYIRLGSRASARIANNQTAPLVGIRIAGNQFDAVRAEAVPDKAGAVDAAMADKYWSDVLARSFSHPLTMRLVAETSK